MVSENIRIAGTVEKSKLTTGYHKDFAAVDIQLILYTQLQNQFVINCFILLLASALVNKELTLTCFLIQFSCYFIQLPVTYCQFSTT